MLSSSSITRIRLPGIADLLAWNHDTNGRALTGLAADRNRAAVLSNDLPGVRHTETESLFLRRIERFEDLFQLLLIDPATRIGDFELKRLIGLLDADTQNTSVRHCFHCVEYEVHQG